MSYNLSFGSTHKVLKAEKILKENDITFRLNPAPKEIAKYCALVITVEDEETVDIIKKLLLENDLPVKGIFKKEGESFEIIYNELFDDEKNK